MGRKDSNTGDYINRMDKHAEVFSHFTYECEEMMMAKEALGQSYWFIGNVHVIVGLYFSHNGGQEGQSHLCQ